MIQQVGPNTTVERLDRFSPEDLTYLLEAQRNEWASRLEWDLREILSLIEDSVQESALEGNVLVAEGEAIGYGFFVPEGRRVLIGEIYVLPEQRGADSTSALVNALLDRISTQYPRRRVESQSVHFDPEGLNDSFAEHGFESASRQFMRVDVDETQAAAHPRVIVREWREADFDRACSVIYESYRGGVDAVANSGYRTREGCADLLDALANSVWCGEFDPELTRVALDRETDRLCGVAIASTISTLTGHLGQISVLPECQSAGIGRALVQNAIHKAHDLGLEALTLAVTSANASAVHLYESCGFKTVLEFPVFYKDV